MVHLPVEFTFYWQRGGNKGERGKCKGENEVRKGTGSKEGLISMPGGQLEKEHSRKGTIASAKALG